MSSLSVIATALKINPGMQSVDWAIIGGMILLLLGLLVYCSRYTRNAADFLAANRCASRYVLSIAEGVAGFAVVSSVATFEMFYRAGFASAWWEMLKAPLLLVLSLVAWVTYRLRETRCFTMAQFFEVRYSRKFRVAAGIITWLSGIFNYGIFPAVSVRFFMFFCRMPSHVMFLGVNWDVYGVLLAFALSMGVLFAVGGGQIAIMVTDFAQGIFCNISFLIFILFIFKLGDWDVTGGYVSWQQISESLITTPGQSQINPFSSSQIEGFNFWYFLIGLVVAVYGRGAWQGSMGYAAAAKNPHERKMAGILGTWRGLAQTLMIMLIPLSVIVIMHHPSFSNLALKVQEVLSQTSDKQLQVQGLVPTALSLVMPTGLLGIFVAVMFAGMLTTDDTYMHSWGSIFIQDVIMPFRKEPFTAKQHLWALRLSVLFVAVFAWCFSYFFRQTEYVYMFFAITGAIVAGAGACLTGGLYWKRGTTLGAWVAYFTSAVLATSAIILQQSWCFRDGSGLSRWLYNRFGWEWVGNNLEKFPINGQWVYFICIATGIFLYIAVSLLDHYVRHVPDFNMDKMLHRGKYDTAHEHVVENTKISPLARRLGITEEFTIGDKLIYGASIAWTLSWFLIFVWFTMQHFLFGGVPDSQWKVLWHCKIYITLVLGFGTTIWFLLGGVIDVAKLFKALNAVKLNDADNGSVVNGENSGEAK